MAKTDGRRDLSLIRASGSTARVLNLSLIYERHGTTDAYNEKPIFKNKRLNKALILKHAVRPHERQLFTRIKSTATKVILPFAASDLGLGGTSFLVGEERFSTLLKDGGGSYPDAADFEHDKELLILLDRLPSFDPFLMRERLRANGTEPARCYFDIAEADIARMRAFVSREISALIALAFAGGEGSMEFSSKLAEKLMTDETAKSLDPLRATLRLSGEDYIEGVFAWKGFLYYSWVMDEFKPLLKEFRPKFEAFRVMRSSNEELRTLAEMRNRICLMMDFAVRRVEESLGEYTKAFEELQGGQAGAFRTFLLKAPSMFIPIGEAVGVIKHIHSFWRFRFPDDVPPIMEAVEALEILNEFRASLESTGFAKKAMPPAAI